eukprot:3280676-Karenia_brevis.AAC.1
MLDANHRSQLALNAYGPLIGKVFGSRALSQELQIDYSNALAFSRLFYNVHLWSVMQPAAVKRLNTTYMRVLRRIASSCRYNADAESDFNVRKRLQMPSIDCIFRTKRLLYASRLARAGPMSLK